MKKADPRLFPYFDDAHEVFPSMKRENRDRMIELADLVNDGLEEMVRRMAEEVGNTSIVYSRAFSEVPIDSATYLSPEDGWHPSPSGHSMLAEAAYRDLVEVLRQLINPN
jgi:lysophospholipase L1-like esterase